MIPETDIWRAASLMIKRYGDRALEESEARADQLATEGEHDGASGGSRGRSLSTAMITMIR